ncbi:hypothetical protein D3C80_488210 [compost metagenome]
MLNETGGMNADYFWWAARLGQKHCCTGFGPSNGRVLLQSTNSGKTGVIVLGGSSGRVDTTRAGLFANRQGRTVRFASERLLLP